MAACTGGGSGRARGWRRRAGGVGDREPCHLHTSPHHPPTHSPFLRLAEREAAQKAETAGGAAAADTPYKAPGGRWGRFRRYSALQRTLEIWSFAVVFFFKLWLVGRKFSYPKKGGGMTPDAVAARKRSLAVWLREGLVKLGPTFIKIGQQFSTRVDVLSPEFVQELEKLQDNVPPFDSALAVATVERSLGGKVGDLFDEFDPQPIAAASLGQVHLARLAGERVVVKVQRPGLKQLFDIDLKNIRLLARWLQAADPKSDGAARDWVAIYDECSRILYQEIDYTLEGASADRFRQNFADSPWIKVPIVLWERTSSEVLTMEYCPGIKVNRAAELDAAGADRLLLAKRLVESYLQQLLTHGFFHADPHPGNVAADAEGGGRLIYYDFGMMGTIPSDVRSGLLELFYGVYQKDPDRCIDALVTMGVLVPGGDRVAVRRTAQFFLDQFQERLDAQRAEAAADPKKYRESFKAELSKEDKKAKRKQASTVVCKGGGGWAPPSRVGWGGVGWGGVGWGGAPRSRPCRSLSLPTPALCTPSADPGVHRGGPAAGVCGQAVPLPRDVHVRRAVVHGARRHWKVARPALRHHRNRRPLCPRAAAGGRPHLCQGPVRPGQGGRRPEPGVQKPVCRAQQD